MYLESNGNIMNAHWLDSWGSYATIASQLSEAWYGLVRGMGLVMLTIGIYVLFLYFVIEEYNKEYGDGVLKKLRGKKSKG